MQETFILNPLDLIIAGVIIFGMYRGAKKGLVNNATRLVAILLSIIFGFRFRLIAESLYKDYLRLNLPGELIAILSFITAFVIVYIVVSAVLGRASSMLDKTNLKIDNALGALFGGGIATLVLSIVLTVLSYFNFPSTNNAQGSVLYPHVRDFARYAVGFGANALRDVHQNFNKYGLGKPASSDNAPVRQPENNDKPAVIR